MRIRSWSELLACYTLKRILKGKKKDIVKSAIYDFWNFRDLTIVLLMVAPCFLFSQSETEIQSNKFEHRIDTIDCSSVLYYKNESDPRVYVANNVVVEARYKLSNLKGGEYEYLDWYGYYISNTDVHRLGTVTNRINIVHIIPKGTKPKILQYEKSDLY